MILNFDPFLLFRALVTLVLGAIWIYTMIEVVGLVVSIVGRSRRNTEAEEEAKELISEVKSLPGRVPPSVVRRLKEARRRLGDARTIRTAKKLVLLKLMQFMSLKTLRFIRRELVLIAILVVMAGFLLSYYYSIVL